MQDAAWVVSFVGAMIGGASSTSETFNALSSVRLGGVPRLRHIPGRF